MIGITSTYDDEQAERYCKLQNLSHKTTIVWGNVSDLSAFQLIPIGKHLRNRIEVD